MYACVSVHTRKQRTRTRAPSRIVCIGIFVLNHSIRNPIHMLGHFCCVGARFFSLHFVGSHTGLVMKFPQIPMSYTSLLQRTVYMSACMSSPHTHLKSTYFEWSNRISDLDGEAHAYFCILALWYSMVIAG